MSRNELHALFKDQFAQQPVPPAMRAQIQDRLISAGLVLVTENRTRARRVLLPAMVAAAVVGGVVLSTAITGSSPSSNQPAVAGQPSAAAPADHALLTQSGTPHARHGGSREQLIQDLIDAGVKYASDGYVDVVTDWENLTATLIIKGLVPPEVAAAMQKVEQAGIAVSVEVPAYSAVELKRATRVLAVAVSESGIAITSLGPNKELSGLQVAGPAVSTDAGLQAQIIEIAAREVPGIPIVFIVEPYSDIQFGTYGLNPTTN